MSTIAKAYVQILPSTKGIKSELQSALGDAGGSAGKSAGASFSSGFGSAIGTVGKVALAGIGAAAAGVGAVVKSAVSSFGEYEQLVGGVETLFGSSSDIVIKNAENAYKTAGMSANAYMETVTSFSASLLQSVGGDTEAAAKTADMALQDMSDNANKMGTSMESIQNAYQGFAKQNYTMLDNLKLGYGGTKSEMERLLSDAEKLTGVKYDISSLDDVYNAIHAVQENLGITGTTAKEAATTIQGSLSQMKASWTNVLTAMGTEGADLSGAIETFIDNIKTFAGNVMPVVQTAMSGLSNLVSQVAPALAKEIPSMINECLPGLLEAGVQVVAALGEGLITSLPTLMPTITEVVLGLADLIVQNLPMIIEVGTQVLCQLAVGIAQALPELIPAVVQAIITIETTLIQNIPLLMKAAWELVKGLAIGIWNAVALLNEVPGKVIDYLKNKFIAVAPRLNEASTKFVSTIQQGISDKWTDILNKVSGWMDTLKQKFLEFVDRFKDIGKNIVEGIKSGISEWWDSLVSDFKEKVAGLVKEAKEALKIGSPSRVFANEVGRWIPEGIAMGIEKNLDVIHSAMADVTDATLANNQNMIPTIAASSVSGYSTAAKSANAESQNNGYNQTINVYSPTALSASEIARQTRNSTRNMVLALRGV